MGWMTQSDLEQSKALANTAPLTDGRDLFAKARRHMVAQDPTIFDVDDKILKDPRTKNGYSYGVRDVSSNPVKPYMSVPAQVWPGVLSVHPGFDRFRYELAVEASKAHKPAIDSDGFANSNAVTRDFSALLSASGAKMSRANAPMTDRSALLADLNFAFGFKHPRHERIARALHANMFGRRVEAPFAFSVRSSWTMPSHYVGQGSQLQKQDRIRYNLSHSDQILDMVWKDDLHGLYRDFGFYFAAQMGERGQAEGVKDLLGGDLTPKERKVIRPKDAIGSPTAKDRVAADKLLVTRQLFGMTYGVGMRVRSVYALCGEISSFISPVLAGNRANYFDEFGITWHHTTAEDIHNKIARFAQLVGLDVTFMDQYMPQFFLDKHAEWSQDYYDERFSKLLRMVNGVPYFAPQLGVGEKPYWAGNPMDPSTFNVDVGLSSGRPDNPDLGKWYMTTVYFCLIDDYLHDLLEQGPNDRESIAAVLRWEHPVFGLLDMGDDAIIGFYPGHEALATKIRADLAKAGETGKAGLSPYAILDLEHGAAFLGNVIVKDALGNIARPKPNPVTFLVNKHCPEKGINTAHSQYYGHGYLAALEHYSKAGSIIGDLIRLEEDLWRIHMDGYPTPNQMAQAARVARPLPTGIAMSEADIAVLLDPNKLNYRFSARDVSQGIRDMFTATIDAEFIEMTMSHIWR